EVAESPSGKSRVTQNIRICTLQHSAARLDQSLGPGQAGQVGAAAAAGLVPDRADGPDADVQLRGIGDQGDQFPLLAKPVIAGHGRSRQPLRVGRILGNLLAFAVFSRDGSFLSSLAYSALYCWTAELSATWLALTICCS